MDNNMITKKTWQQFRDTGLFLFVNSILHAFGWALVVKLDDNKEVVECFPARVKFRGFSEADTEDAHKKIGSYLKEASEELFKEATA